MKPCVLEYRRPPIRTVDLKEHLVFTWSILPTILNVIGLSKLMYNHPKLIYIDVVISKQNPRVLSV